MTCNEIKVVNTQLPAAEVIQLVSSLLDYEAECWDKQIENDLEIGRLDSLMAEVENV